MISTVSVVGLLGSRFSIERRHRDAGPLQCTLRPAELHTAVWSHARGFSVQHPLLDLLHVLSTLSSRPGVDSKTGVDQDRT